jgi:tetratricopeptide (TPR) repeat protein
MNAPLKFLVSVLIVLVFVSTLSHAQSPGAAEANQAAYGLFSQGKYSDAAAAYEKLLKDYPTDAIVGVAQIQLAFSYFFMGRFDDALAQLKKATSGPPLPPELKQVADGLLPQILAAKASAMPAADAKRKTAFEEAIAKFTAFITAYPKAEDLENVIYSRAISNYQIGKYDETVKDCELNIQQFPQSPTIATTKNLLAITLATQGSIELSKSSDKDKAFPLYKRAADTLRELIKNKQDVALYNEANFQLAEILFNQAGFSDEAARPALFKEALEAYRAIVPKDEIIKMQQDRVAAFPERRAAAALQRNQALLKQLDRENLRELTKLEELKNKTDQVASALLKMSEIFYQQGNINAARTLLRHVARFLTTDDDKKRAQYFMTMTYALQGNTDLALAGYEEFQSKHKGDALADNLPVTIGSMLLGQNKPQDAIKYFDESLTIYPSGRFVGLSVVNKATAESKMGQNDSAAKTFQDFLSKNPPPEIGVIAQSGLANIYKDTAKWDEAIAAYKTVVEKFPNTPQAIEAGYWIGLATQQKGDNAAAIPLLDAFVKAQPEHPYASLALYSKGGAQLATNDKAGGVESLALLAEKYPDSPAAPFTYFMRAQFAGQDGKADEVVALMKQFIEKYPKDDKIFFAYESVAQSYLQGGKPDEGLAMYREFAQKYEDLPQAADALQKVAELQRAAAEGLGRYGALNEAERTKWTEGMDSATSTAEELLTKYPDSPQVALALRTLLQIQRLKAGAEISQPSEVETYFKNLSDAASNPSTKSKIMFALADYVKDQDSARAFEIMSTSYDPQVVYSPTDLDTFGLALLTNKKNDEAAAVFEKLAKDYPVPAGVSPTKASPLVQEAQANALFGKARIAQESGQTAEAGKLFEQLKTLYKWSPKVLEADYGIAQSYKAQGKGDEAIALLGAIIRANTATADLRANSFLLFGDIMLDKKNTATDPKEKEKFLAASIDNYLKVAQFYGGVPKAASRGLWLGAQLLEEQANASTDAKFKTAQLAKAKAAYETLVKDYPASEFAQKAQERVAALGK